MTRIDVGSVLRNSANLPFSDLVTRPTGAAVRRCIQTELAALSEGDVALLDFSQIGMMDYSCADEVVAKLLLRYGAETPGSQAYFIFRGLNEAHRHAIEAALSRYSLALVLEAHDGSACVVGAIDDEESKVWEAVREIGTADVETVAATVGAEMRMTARVLDQLFDRRLVVRLDHRYIAIGARGLARWGTMEGGGANG